MSILATYREDGQCLDVSNDYRIIADKLREAGVLFERWQATRPMDNGASQDEILKAYKDSVDRLTQAYDFQSVDVVTVTADSPNKEALRKKFLDEHTHSDFEIRFFVDGAGLFFIHVQDKVFGILCKKGDLIGVPADIRHWFDMGVNPRLKCIRLFTIAEGWVAQNTGSDIAKKFPTFDDFIVHNT